MAMSRPAGAVATGVLVMLPMAAMASGAPTRVDHRPVATPDARVSLRADFNGDGFADLAIAAPGERPGGAVHVLYGSADGLTAQGSQVWSQDSRGVAGRSEPGDDFGASLAVGDLDGDGLADLAIGVPGEGHTGTALSGPGVVEVLYGSAQGLTATRSRRWSQDTAGVAGTGEPRDAFGAALVIADLVGGRRADLAVGVPGENRGRGVVQVLPGSPRGLRAAGSRWWSQDAPGVPGRAQPDDRFGGALAAGDLNGDGRVDLAIGAAGEERGAGAVDVLYGATEGLTGVGAQLWTQATPGVIGRAESGDGFGGSLAAADFDGDGRGDLAVGVPGETLAVVAEAAGAVNVLYGAGSGLTPARNQLWTADSPGIADVSRPREGFGTALAAGDFDGDGRADLAVGVPFESLGDPGDLIPEAGIVHVLPGSPAGITATGSQVWSQDSPGVPGRAEESDRFGSSLATGDFDTDGRTDLAVGSPGETLDGRFGAGAVHVMAGSATGLTSAGCRQWSLSTPGIAGAPGRSSSFGWTLASGTGPRAQPASTVPAAGG